MNALQLSDGSLSDLFFNHEHPNYAGCFGENVTPKSQEEIATAIRADADQFASEFGGWTGEQYASDFLKRV